MNLDFYKGKKVFITGHTGFKGSWMCEVLYLLGAEVTGYALAPEGEKNLYSLLHIQEKVTSIIGDIRDREQLADALKKAQPEIVIHMAAQPLVKEGYANPVYTYDVNVMGTVNILETVRMCNSVKSFVNVTTDKVYENKEWDRGYVEEDVLNGYDPYSNSKSCSELVTSSYKKSFFQGRDISISTCRAGNVIGGGDFAANRIVPDCVRAMEEKRDIVVRNPNSIRPYQHVLEPVVVYLNLARLQYENALQYEGNYNIGPNDEDCITTSQLADIFCEYWKDNAKWVNISENSAPHEANILKLDCSKIRKTLNWSPQWDIRTAIEKTVQWSKYYLAGNDVREITDMQIKEFLGIE